MMSTVRKMLSYILFAVVLAVLMLMPLSASAEEPGEPGPVEMGYNVETEEYTLEHGNPDWFIRLTHLKLKMTVSGDVGFFYAKGDVALTVSGEFEIEIKKPTGGEYHYSYLRQIVPSWVFKLPIIHTFDPKGDIVAKASGPMKVTGNFEDTIHFTLVSPIWESDLTHVSSFNVTHVEPKTKEKGTFYIGNDSALSLKMLYVKIGGEDVFGPVIEFHTEWKAGISGKDIQLKKDEWEAKDNCVDDSITELHSCTENGREGCVSGKNEESNSVKGYVHIKIFKVVDEYFRFKDKMEWRGWRSFVESLTWKEGLKYQENCNHLYYKVPAAVWGDPDKETPLKGVCVRPTEAVRTDPNVKKLTYGKTGENKTIKGEKAEGRVNLYLPWKAGKYTLEIDPENSDPKYRKLRGSAEQPSPMRRGLNDQVDIFPASEKIKLTADKTWDIDLEYMDKPDSIEVAVQAQKPAGWTTVQKATLKNGNGWQYTFEVPKYMVDDEGRYYEVKYRIRELEPKNEDEAADDEDKPVANGKTVTFKVSGYISPTTGEYVAEHKTKYKVSYDVSGNTTNITNLAILDFIIDKEWLNFGDSKKPDYVYLALTYRVKSKWLEQVPDSPVKRLAKTWVPVYKPLSGDMINLLNVIGLGWLKKFDITGLSKYLNVPFAIGKASDSNHWRLIFTVKKYGFLIVPKIPTEFKAMELTSAVVNALFKWLTGLDITLPISINPEAGRLYISFPAELKDGIWVIVNVQAGGAKTVIGGLKRWADDREEVRPEYIDIHVKDPDTGREICDPIRLKKKDFPGREYWVWSLKDTQVYPGVKLDDSKTYLISETFPEEYDNSYVCTVSGHNLLNEYVGDVRLVVKKEWEPDLSAYKPKSVRVSVYDDKNQLLKTDYLKHDRLILMDGKDGVRLKGKDISRFTIKEEMFDTPKSAVWVSTVSGPVRTKEGRFTTYTFTLRNSLQKRVRLAAEKVWEDDDASIRPGSVKVTFKRKLTKDGKTTEETVATRSLSGITGWKAVLDKNDKGEDLLRYDQDGEEYFYYVEEDVPKGYRCKTERKAEEYISYTKVTFTLTNTAETYVTVKGTKIWDDDNDSGRIRPASLFIRVMTEYGQAYDKDGNPAEKEITGSGNQWAYSFPDLPEMNTLGKRYSYRVAEFLKDSEGKEIPVPGYTTTYLDPTYDADKKTWTCDIENSNQDFSVFVQKIWNDNENETGQRPKKVTVRLIQTINGAESEKASVELSEDNSWFHRFGKLPRRDELGHEITYSISEDPVPCYDTSIEFERNETADTWIITNNLRPSMMITINKEWVGDEELSPGDRPASVTVTLSRDLDGWSEQLVLTQAGNWTRSLEVDRMTPEGEVYTYTLKEDPVPKDYRCEITPESITGDYTSEDTFTVMNRYYGSRMNIPVRKTWMDGGRTQDRPDHITVALYANGESTGRTLELSGANSWQGAFDGVDREDSEGVPIVYTISEVLSNNCYDSYIYPSDVRGDEYRTEGFTLVNIEFASLTIRAKWEADHNDAAGNRPEKLLVELQANGRAIQTVELSGSGEEWTAVVDHLPVYASDEPGAEPIVYTIEEDPVPGYLDPQYTPASVNLTEASPVLTVINELQTIEIRVVKKWEGDLERPDQIAFRLYGELTAYGSYTLKSSENWETVIKDVPTHLNGYEITYSVQEAELPQGYHYTSYISGSLEEGFEIINTPTKRDITVKKIWIDAEGSYPSIPVRLLSDQKTEGILEEVASVTLPVLGRDDAWTYTFRDLPEYNGDRLIHYDVEEDVPAGFDEPEIVQEWLDLFRITNWKRKDTMNVSVQKYWDDYQDSDCLRPSSVTVDLVRSGTVIQSAELNEENEWAFVFRALNRRDDDGVAYQYSVQERPVEHYATSYESFTLYGNQSWLIVNTHDVETISISGIKEWHDDNDRDGLRPSDVTLNVLADGMEWIQINTSEDDGWKFVCDKLPKKIAGHEVNYTIEEEPIPGYTSTVTGDMYSGFIVTNTHEPKTIAVTGSKFWLDDDDEKGLRPESIVIHLLANGVEKESRTVTEDDGWSWTFPDLPEYSGGKLIDYTIYEDPVDHYIMEIDTYNVINILETKTTTDVVVEKYWLYGEQQNVTVDLLSDRAARGKMEKTDQVTLPNLGADDPWIYSFEEQPTFTDDGRVIRYSVSEEPPEGYEKPIIIQEGWYQFEITNAQKKDTLDIMIVVDWDDDDDAQGARPEEVLADLLKDGEVDEEVSLTREGQWITYRIDYSKEAEWNLNPHPVEQYVTNVEKSEELLPYGFLVFRIVNTLKRAAPYQIEYYYEKDGEYPAEPDAREEVSSYVGEKVTLSTEQKTPQKEGYVLDESRSEAWSGVVAKDGSTKLKAYFRQEFTITYNLNGGILDGSSRPIKEKHYYGDEITILDAPVRSGYDFRYWKGSKYNPGDSYTVTGDHTFVAQWYRDDPKPYKFTFTKEWIGTVGDSISWTLYNPDGSVRHKKFDKKVLDVARWQYTAWFDSVEDYYLIEEVPKGYKVRYENVGIHAGETDRCYEGGTIYNYKIPKTDDRSGLLLWLALALLGGGLTGSVLLAGRCGREKQQTGETR